MPISENKLEANRRNAEQSSGPKTISGKAISSRNALKHGCYSDQIVIRDHHINENPEDYDRLLAAITNQLKPDNYFEESIVLKIANCLWRSHRVVLAEAALIREELADIDPQMDRVELFRLSLDKSAERELRPTSRRAWQRERRSRAAQCLVPDRRYTHDLQLYEMRLDRQLARLYRLYCSIKQTSPLDLGAPPLRGGFPTSDNAADPNTKTTETNPTTPEPQQLTPIPESSIDHLPTISEPESAHSDAILLGVGPFVGTPPPDNHEESNLDSRLHGYVDGRSR